MTPALLKLLSALPFSREFTGDTSGEAQLRAERYAQARGFIVGPQERNEPQALVLEGSPSKWRYLTPSYRRQVDGVILGDRRYGPVTVRLRVDPDEAPHD